MTFVVNKAIIKLIIQWKLISVSGGFFLLPFLVMADKLYSLAHFLFFPLFDIFYLFLPYLVTRKWLYV